MVFSAMVKFEAFTAKNTFATGVPDGEAAQAQNPVQQCW
jgi:hypothetical protein